MTPIGPKLAKIFLPVALSVLNLGQGFAAEYRCDTADARAIILSDDPLSASLACDGVKRATAFLRAQGLDVSSKIDIELVARLANENAAGHLLGQSEKALVLNYRQFREFRDWLRVPIDTEIYRALVAHEVAHVIAGHNFLVQKPSIVAHEYIAYVTTFATMDANRRERVLAEFSGDGFETEQQINTTIYLCDPMRFGAEAYRHFVTRGRDADYFRSILSGRKLNN